MERKQKKMSVEEAKPKPKVNKIEFAGNTTKIFLESSDKRYIEAKITETAEKIIEIGGADKILGVIDNFYFVMGRAKTYKKRAEKIAKEAGYKVEYFGGIDFEKFNADERGDFYFKLVKDPEAKPVIKEKTSEELRLIGFKNVHLVKEGDDVEVRFTNSNKAHRYIGKVQSVNAKSLRVTYGNYGAYTLYFRQNTINNGVFLIPEGKLEEVRAAVEKHNADRDARDKVINDAISEFYKTHEVKITSIGPISMSELAHPTTAESVKIKAQMEVADERQQIFHNVLGNFVDKKLKAAGQEGL